MPPLNNAWLMKQRELRRRADNNPKTAPAHPPADSPNPSDAQPDSEQNEVVLTNINTATLAELVALPHLGDITAGRIETNRPYADLAELKAKSGVTLSKSQWLELSALIGF